MAAIIVMSNGDAYHTTTAIADEVLRLTDESNASIMTASFIDVRSGKQVTIFLSQISSVVRDEQ